MCIWHGYLIVCVSLFVARCWLLVLSAYGRFSSIAIGQIVGDISISLLILVVAVDRIPSSAVVVEKS